MTMQHADISILYERGNISTKDNEASLKRAAALIRVSYRYAQIVNIFGYSYNIDAGKVTD